MGEQSAAGLLLGDGRGRLQDEAAPQGVLQLQQQRVVVGVEAHVLHGVPLRPAAHGAGGAEHAEDVHPAQVVQLHDVEQEAAQADAEHEVEEDGHLCGMCHKACRACWARVGLAAE